MEWKNGIVAVFTPTIQGCGHWGTGISISEDLVLTARHVLYPKEEEYGDHIKLCWFGSKKRKNTDGEEHRVYETVKRDKILELGDGIDVVLIRCPPPDDVPGFIGLDCRKPNGNLSWEGFGFAKVAKIGDQRDAGHFKGEQQSGAEFQNYVEFIVTNPPEREMDWSGCSGMPIVSLDTNAVIAVCTSIVYDRASRVLQAVPVSNLLKYEKFREYALQKISCTERKLLLISELNDEIDPNADWMTAFANKLGGNVAEAFRNGDGNYVNEMLSSGFSGGQLMQALHTVYEVRHEAQTDISKFASRLVPILIEDSALSRGGKNCDVSVGCTGTKTMAELLAAFLDGRSACFHPRASKLDRAPNAKYLLPIAPASGHGDDVSLQMAKHIVKDLVSQIKPFNEKAILCYFENCTDVYSPEHEGRRLEDEMLSLSSDLRSISEHMKIRFYLAISFSRLKPLQVRQLNEVLANIRTFVPEILIFELHPDFELEDKGFIGAYPFMLPIKGEND